MAFFGLGLFYGGVIVGVPTVTGVAEGVSHQQRINEEAANETRMAKFYIDVSFPNGLDSVPSGLRNLTVVLAKDKVWAVPKHATTGSPVSLSSSGSPEWTPHPFTGFFIMYPDEQRNPAERGLVSTISSDPPMLNWIYVDRDTLEVKYGNRTQSIRHVVGTWDWTEDEAAVILDDWEGFVLVDEGPGRADGLRWALYHDRYDDDFGGNGNKVGGRKRYEVCLERRLLPEEVRKAQEDAADGKMRVKTTGDLKTKFEEPGSSRAKKS